MERLQEGYEESKTWIVLGRSKYAVPQKDGEGRLRPEGGGEQQKQQCCLCSRGRQHVQRLAGRVEVM